MHLEGPHQFTRRGASPLQLNSLSLYVGINVTRTAGQKQMTPIDNDKWVNMRRRLVNRSGAGSNSQPASQTPDAEPTNEAVTYQPPSFPLNEVAVNKLGDLSRTRDTLVYQNQIKDAVRHLGHSVYDLQDRLNSQRARLDQIRTRNNDRGVGKQAEEERLEKYVAEFEADIDSLTKQSEAAVRATVDRRNTLEDDAMVLGDLYTTAEANQRRDQAREEGQDDEDDEPPSAPSTLDSLRDHRARNHAAYTSTSHYQRYALDNDYAGFKRLWHDGLAGDEGPPLPDASKWFRPDGTPVIGTTLEVDAHDGSDDDVAVAREVISLNCPLTLRPMQEPYSNRKCKHTFEKSAILDYLRNGHGPMQCPQTGCDEKFTMSSFDQDFYLDQVVLRRIQRAMKANENHEMEVESEDEGESEVVVRGQRSGPGAHMKGEPV